MTPGPERAHHTDVSSRPTRIALVLAIFSTVSLGAGLVISLFTHIHAGPSPHWTVVRAAAAGDVARTARRRDRLAPAAEPDRLVDPLLRVLGRGPGDAGLPRAVDARRRHAGRAVGRLGLDVAPQPGVRRAVPAAAAAVPGRAPGDAPLPAAAPLVDRDDHRRLDHPADLGRHARQLQRRREPRRASARSGRPHRSSSPTRSSWCSRSSRSSSGSGARRAGAPAARLVRAHRDPDGVPLPRGDRDLPVLAVPRRWPLRDQRRRERSHCPSWPGSRWSATGCTTSTSSSTARSCTGR